MKNIIKKVLTSAIVIIIAASNCSFAAAGFGGQENLHNIALGKSVTESFNDGRKSAPKEVVTDGEISTKYWRATASEKNGEAYLIVDLENDYACDNAKILLQGIGEEVIVNLMYSADGAEWKNYGALSSNCAVAEKGLLEFDLPVTEKIRFVKVSVSSINKIFAVYEIMVYGVPFDAGDDAADLENIALGLTPTASSTQNNDTNLRPGRVTDGAGGGWPWITHDGDSEKYLDIDLGAWYNIKKISFTAVTKGVGNDGENSRRLIDIYGSATGQFEEEKIKLSDIGMAVLDFQQTQESVVRVPNMVRYIRVTPKSKKQFGSGYDTARFGFNEIRVFADKSDSCFMTEKSDDILNDRQYDLLSTGNESFMTKVIMKPAAVQFVTSATADNVLTALEYNLYGGFEKDEDYILIASETQDAGVNFTTKINEDSFVKYIQYENISESECVSEIFVFYKEKDDSTYLEINDVILCDENGTERLGLNYEKLNVKAKIFNKGTEAVSGTAVVALYDKDMCAVAVNTAQFEGKVDEECEFFVTVDNPAYASDMTGYKLKVFFVETTKAINPLRNSVIFR